MPPRTRLSGLGALGLSEDQEALYQRLVALSGYGVDAVAFKFVVPIAELRAAVAPLVDRGLVVVADEIVTVPPLSAVMAAAVAEQAASAATASSRLVSLATAIGSIGAAANRPDPSAVGDTLEIRGELTTGGHELELLGSIIRYTEGDLLWLRPDAWRLPREHAITRIVGEAIDSGRRSRAVYPAVALREAPDALRARADAGEEVRVVEDLPTRLLVLGHTHAILPEPLGHHGDPRLLIRQPAVVEALALLFDAVWERSEPLADADRGSVAAERRRLLRQLARGAKDEQIARVLGLSLRTVRRRVSDLLIELGVETRFQAGAEAVRRGWL